jgi:hypothetical protein
MEPSGMGCQFELACCDFSGYISSRVIATLVRAMASFLLALYAAKAQLLAPMFVPPARARAR